MPAAWTVGAGQCLRATAGQVNRGTFWKAAKHDQSYRVSSLQFKVSYTMCRWNGVCCACFIFVFFFCRWESLGSPHKLAWYWLQVLEKWTKEQVKLLQKSVKVLTYLWPKLYVWQLVKSVFFHSHFQVSPENREELEFLLLLEELGSEGITEDVIKVTRSLLSSSTVQNSIYLYFDSDWVVDWDSYSRAKRLLFTDYDSDSRINTVGETWVVFH